MKILLSHVKQYVDLPESLEEISLCLLNAGIEIDSVEHIQPLFKGAIAVVVRKTERHPNAEKLTLATIFDGVQEHRIVCGAPNCKEGLTTAFAPIGATLYPEGLAGAPFVIREATIRGVASPGMLLSEKELGLGADHDGIISLDGVEPGTEVATLIEDVVLELGLTPNLGHAMSVRGIARELSIQLGKPMKQPKWQHATIKCAPSHFVQIENRDICPRYSALEVKNVHVGPSPFAIRRLLSVCGMRSVNSIVDITNLCLLELGQPMHAFDAQKLQGTTLTVRTAGDNQVLDLLDGQKKELPPYACVIADGARVVAAGGIMGGQETAVTSDTQSVLFESAHFSPTAIRRAAKTLQISSESSKRFERGCDPAATVDALQYTLHLLQQIAPQCSITRFFDEWHKESDTKQVRCRVRRASHILGYPVSLDEMELCWKRLGFDAQWEDEDTCLVSVPLYRHDIMEEVDLIEDIAKILGYQQGAIQAPRYQGSTRPHHPLFLAEQVARKRLVAEGLQECITCNLISPQMVDVVLRHPIRPENVVAMLNPLSSEQSVLRPSLLPGLLKVMKHNINQRNLDMRCFEIGNVHLQLEDGRFEEQLVVGIMMSGQRELHHFESASQAGDFYDLKGVVENFLQGYGISSAQFQESAISVFHTKRQAAIMVGEVVVGMMGELHPAALRKLDVSQRIYFAECDIQELMKLECASKKMRPLPLFPASERDWTVTVSEEIAWGTLEQSIRQMQSPLLEQFWFVTVYRSEAVGPGRKNMTIHFVYRKCDETISQEEVDREHKKITEALAAIVGG